MQTNGRFKNSQTRVLETSNSTKGSNTSGSITSSNCGGTRIEKPSPKNRNQDLVFEIPQKIDFEDEVSAAEMALGGGVSVRVRERRDNAAALRAKSRFEASKQILEEGLGEMDLGVGLGLGFWGGFGEEERRR